MADIFISYAREDRERIASLVAALEDEGFSVWWDRLIEGGEQWAEETERQLTAARAVPVVWTGFSRKKRWVREEAEEALNQGKLIPLAFEDGAIPFGFKSIHAEDFIGWDGDTAAECWGRLILQARALIGEGALARPAGEREAAAAQAPSKPGGAVLTFLAMILALAGIVGSIRYDWGGLGVVVALAGGVFLLFRTADTELPAHLKALAGRWLLPVRDGVRISVAEAFNNLFEAVFAPRHLSIKCVWRSVIASMLGLAAMTGLAWAFIPDFQRAMSSFGAVARNTILLTVATNILGDYVSLWQTRLFLRWGARAPALMPLIVTADAILTGVLYLAVLVGSFFILQPLFSDFLSYSWTGEEYRALTPIELGLTLLPQPTASGALSAEQWFVAFSILTTYVTSAWLWAVLAFGPVARIFLDRDGQVTWFARIMGAERNPFTVLGFLAALLIIAVGAPLSRLAPDGESRWETFKDCEVCPEMVVVPAGSFLMGSPQGEAGRFDYEDDRPGEGGSQVRIDIARPFAVGIYEVTFAEWDSCVADGGCGGHRPLDFDWGRGGRPVGDVSWNDAQDYIVWLNEKTESRFNYRLLSEAEWEYAARAGTTTRYAFGDEITPQQANFQGARTRVVGAYPPNAFGLYDMHGNVWEWVEDCYHDSYDGAPPDGSVWPSPSNESCTYRVLRGGSWYLQPEDLRSADRFGINPGSRIDLFGFRISRTLD